MRKMVSSGSPYEIPIGFSRAVRVGDVIAVSGTAPIASDGSTACVGDPYGQTKRCLEIIQRAIEDLGGKLSDVIRTRIFVTDMTKWEQIGRAHGEIFGEIRPASSIVEVTSLASRDWFVEVEADCIVTGN